MFYNYSQKYKKSEAWCEVMFQALGLCVQLIRSLAA